MIDVEWLGDDNPAGIVHIRAWQPLEKTPLVRLTSDENGAIIGSNLSFAEPLDRLAGMISEE